MDDSTQHNVYSKITSKYQVTLPKAVREYLKVSANDTIKWSLRLHTTGEISVSVAHPDLWEIIKTQKAALGDIDVSSFAWE